MEFLSLWKARFSTLSVDTHHPVQHIRVVLLGTDHMESSGISEFRSFSQRLSHGPEHTCDGDMLVPTELSLLEDILSQGDGVGPKSRSMKEHSRDFIRCLNGLHN